MEKKKNGRDAARAADEKRTARIRIVIACAAVLLLICAAVAVGVVLSRSDDDEAPKTGTVEMSDIESAFERLKQSGTVVGNYVYNENDLTAKEEELAKAGVTVVIRSGCYATSRDGEAYAYECESEEQASALYAYYEANLVSGYRARRSGRIVICGTEELLGRVLFMSGIS